MAGLDLDTTLQKITEKNKRIRERLKGLDETSTDIRHKADVSTRLSYGTWSTQDFLSSTRLSTSAAAPKSSVKKVKASKKFKKKIQEAIQFSSEEEESQSLLKAPLRTKKVIKKGAPEPPNVAKPSKEGTPTLVQKSRSPLTIRHDNDPNSKQPLSGKKSRETTTKTKKTLGKGTTLSKSESSETSTFPDTTNSSRGLHSSSLSSSISSVSSKKEPKPTSSTTKKSSVKKKPVSKKKLGFVQTIQFSSESDQSDVENTFNKVQELRKKVREGSFLRKFASTSSESSANGSITHKPAVADHMKGGLHLKRFVMDSDSDEEDSKDKEDGISKERIVLDTMDQENTESEESVDEAFVTIPCSQDNLNDHSSTEKNKKRATCRQNQESESEKDSEKSDLVIPDSQSDPLVLVQDTETPENEESPQDGDVVVIPCSQDEKTQSPSEGNTATPEEHFITIVKAAGSSEPSEDSESIAAHRAATSAYFVPDSEAPDSEESDKSAMAQNQLEVDACDINTVPDSQLDVTPERPSTPAGQQGSTQCNDTPSLVNRLVNLVRSVSSSPAKLLFGSSPSHRETPTQPAVSAKSSRNQKKVAESPKTVPQPTPKPTPGGKKFFEVLQFSSEEEDVAESCISETKSSSDHSSVHDSSCQSQLDRSEVNELSQRLQQILSKSTKKKKLVKGKKKVAAKTKPPKKPLYSNTSEDSSFEGRHTRTTEEDVTVPDSQSCRTEDDVSMIGDSQALNILAPNTESLEVDENPDIPEICVPDSQQTNLDLQMSVSRSGGSSLMPTQESTVRYNPRCTSNKDAPSILTDDDEDLSPEIPYCGPEPVVGRSNRAGPASPRQDTRVSYGNESSSTEELHMDRSDGEEEETEKQKVDMSLQVSMMSPADDSDTDSMTSPPVPQREISIQVSMVASESDEDTLNSSPEKQNPDDNSGEKDRSDISGDEARASEDESMETDESTPSPPRKVASFSAQVSIMESPEDTYGQRVSYDGVGVQDRSQDISAEISGVAKDLRGELDQENRDVDQVQSDEEGKEAASSSGSENEGYESAEEGGEGAQLQNMSLQVSMCFESEPPEHVPDMEGSILDISSDDEPPPLERKQENNRNRIQSPPESPEIEVFSDDSDADPDFQVAPTKKPNKKTPQKPKEANVTKTRKKTKSGGSKSGEEKENLTEAQTIKTVLLCEKKESVTGVTDDMDDDFTLPDLSPPRVLPNAARPPPCSESSEDDFDAYLERLRTSTKKKKPTKSMEDFIVEDEDVSSNEEGDNNTSVFYVRTDRVLNKTPRNRTCVGDDSNLFKTPSHLPSRNANRTPQPGPSRMYSKTPGPSRLQNLLPNNNNVRPNSTGHLPQFYGFLKSLSTNISEGERHPEAKRYVKDFKKQREALSQKLFKLYNESVFDKKLPEDLNIKWNSRLLTTAGFCAYKRDKTAPTGRVTRIELSVKVCDSAERVRDTLIHELCHAAVWLVFGKNDGHGRYWQSFAQKAMRVHNDLPTISRCHTYDINHKFIYKCTKCGQQIGRHTKSLNTEKKVCGFCRGKFEVHINTPNGLTPQKPRTPRTPNKFALFVKENYNIIKQRNNGFKHVDVMKALSAEFAAKAKVTE